MTNLLHAKTSPESKYHVSAFHANFRLKSYTVSSEVVVTQPNSERAVAQSVQPLELNFSKRTRVVKKTNDDVFLS